MSQFQINNKQNMDYTLVANSFIDNFLADANDAQIKVYLFLLRHMNTPHMCSISAMADFYNYSKILNFIGLPVSFKNLCDLNFH